MESTPSQQSYSSSQQHYSALLSTVAELRTDLERTLNKIHYLEDVNKDLSSNFQTVKEELIETRKKYMEAQENYQKSAASKLESDKLNSMFMERIKVQLAEKTKEFDLLRDKFIPQDMDYIRIKVQEELEIPHKQRILAMEAEIERQKDLYFAMRRESERYKADYEYFSQAQQREVDTIRAEHEMELTSLRNQIHSLQSKDIGGEREERLRALQIKVQELQRTTDLLKQGRESFIAEKDSLTTQLETMKAQHEQNIIALRAQIATIQAENTKLEHKCGSLSSEAELKDTQLHALKQQFDDSQSQLEHNALLLQEKDASLQNMKESHVDQMDRVRVSAEEDIRNKDQEIGVLEHRLSEREEMIRRIQKEAGEMQLRAEVNEGEIRRAHLARLQEIKLKNDGLEVESAALKRDLQLSLIQRTEIQEKASKEMSLLRSEIARIKREKDVLLNRSMVVEQSLDAERRKLSSSKRLTSARAAMSNDLVLEMKMKIADLEKVVQDAREKEIKMSSDLRSAEEMLAHKEKEFSLSMETMQREAHSRYEQLGKEYKEQLGSMKLLAQRAVLKERKRAEAYKEKALEAHQRGKLLSAVMNAGSVGAAD